MRHASETRWGANLVGSKPWRAVVRSPAWKHLTTTESWRVALNVRELLHGRDLLRENRRLARTEEARSLERLQAEYVISSFVERSFDGAELPPPELRLRVGSTEHAYEFLAKGIRSSGIVLDTFGTAPAAPILDWGCGSGSTYFFLRRFPGWQEQYHGCDVDPEAVAWLTEHGARHVSVCGDSPPLPYADETFAGVFAFSVLTHIPADLHRRWYEEFHRILVPDGRLLFTTYGPAQAARSSVFVQEDFDRASHAWIPCRTPNHHFKDKCMVSAEFTDRALAGLFEFERYSDEGYAHWYGRGQDLIVTRRLPG